MDQLWVVSRQPLITVTGHRRIASILLALSFVAAICSCRTRPVCILHPVVLHHYSTIEVSGQWIGFTGGDPDLFRLELRVDGTGVLTQAFTGATNVEAMRFEIPRWDITNNILTCAFSQPDVRDSLKIAWPVEMTCNVNGTWLEAMLRNGEGGWKKSIVFCREKDLDEKLRVLRQ